ncbi:MAG: hypothetical protein K6T81_13495 [Alicyclobacillus macrosporangiidus]|uniref:hypothetical protein n=1 Tax=Alicyclobacillus macrosporangiidus TaxID=392015 RepID=UPI0026F19019|nr:hypothetical protein [Alicyclobacillus macrosporangiidus]MCL6599735.1 hypothetical protein [Alicyclobacillus macrosporangiidus]
MTKHRRIGLGLTSAASLFAALAIHPALASAATSTTKPKHAMVLKEIDLNDHVMSKPYGFTYSNTAYMPIWYVMQALRHLGIQSQWDGRNWRITTPAGETPDLSSIQVGTGNLNIYVNGKLAKKVVGIVDIDPASKSATTFMPVWYVMQILRGVGVTPDWNGTKWTMETDNNLTDYQPEDVLYAVDAYTTNLTAEDDPVALFRDLRSRGYATQDLIDEVTQAEAQSPDAAWTKFAQANGITSGSLDDASWTIVREGKVDDTHLLVELQETDTVTFSDGTQTSYKQVVDWGIMKDASGLWQVDYVFPVSQDPIKTADGKVIDPGFQHQSLFDQTDNATGTDNGTNTTNSNSTDATNSTDTTPQG